jgi:hypothetical protein
MMMPDSVVFLRSYDFLRKRQQATKNSTQKIKPEKKELKY